MTPNGKLDKNGNSSEGGHGGQAPQMQKDAEKFNNFKFLNFMHKLLKIVKNYFQFTMHRMQACIKPENL
jgi:hypothetical protein